VTGFRECEMGFVFLFLKFYNDVYTYFEHRIKEPMGLVWT